MGSVRVRRRSPTRLATALLAAAAALVFVVACTPARNGGAESRPARPVFQVDTPIVLGPIFKAAGYGAPLVTVWDSGRVVFRYLKPGGGPGLHETALKSSEVQAILQEAELLYDLGDTFSTGADGSLIRFSVDSERGRKVVSVRGFDGFGERPYPVDESGDSRRIRELWTTVREMLPSEAPPMQPDEVIVRVEPELLAGSRELPASEVTRATKAWSGELVGYLRGEQSRSATSLLDPGEMSLFLVDGALRYVTVQPVLPRLYEPTPNWSRAGIPRHPDITAYDAPGMPYRFMGVSRQEVATWYRNEMPSRGWRLGGEVESRRQVWHWERYDPSPLLVVLDFQPSEMTIKRVELEQGIPLKGHSEVCDEARCQVVTAAIKAEVEAWFAEFMPYAGWDRQSDGNYRKGSWRVRLEVRESGNQAAQVLVHRAWIPGPGEPLAISDDQAVELARRAAGTGIGDVEHISARLTTGSELLVHDGRIRPISEQDSDGPYWIVEFRPGVHVVVNALGGLIALGLDDKIGKHPAGPAPLAPDVTAYDAPRTPYRFTVVTRIPWGPL